MQFSGLGAPKRVNQPCMGPIRRDGLQMPASPYMYGEVAFSHHQTIFRLTNGLTRYDDDKQEQRNEQRQDERQAQA